MKLKKGSKAAKDFMAKIRAKRKKNVSGLKKKVSTKPKYVKILGQKVKEGTKLHQKLIEQKKYFDDLLKSEVGAIKIIEKGESKSTKPKAYYLQQRTKTGAFKGRKKIGSSSGSHKDTKSHNVNIRVVSGIGASMYSVRDNLEKEIQRAVYQLEILKGKKKAGLLNDPFDKKLIIRYPKYIQNLKKQLREQNKLITNNLK